MIRTLVEQMGDERNFAPMFHEATYKDAYGVDRAQKKPPTFADDLQIFPA